jgi:RNA polymerase sigma-70 factor (ECF subfamily)
MRELFPVHRIHWPGSNIGDIEMAKTDALIVDLIPALRAFARSFYRNPTDADDLVQDTLTRALASVDQFTAGTRLKSWLFTIMRNAFYTKIKIYNRESPGDQDCVSLMPYREPGQEWMLALKEVEGAINRLPPDQREALVLIGVLGTSYEDAAMICKCPVGTIKSRLNRARQNVIDDLGEGSSSTLVESSPHGGAIGSDFRRKT